MPVHNTEFAEPQVEAEVIQVEAELRAPERHPRPEQRWELEKEPQPRPERELEKEQRPRPEREGERQPESELQWKPELARAWRLSGRTR